MTVGGVAAGGGGGEDPSQSAADAPARVLVVGSGFAGLHTARALERTLPAGKARITLVSPTDYMLYSPLLPEVAAGVMDPRHIVVPLAQSLRRATPVLGFAVDVDLERRVLTVQLPSGQTRQLDWDRLVLCPGSVTRDLPVPGLDEYARGFKSLAEALYLRDHVLQQLELADVAQTPDERAGRCTFLVVGAGYAGTEFVAQMQHFLAGVLPRYRHLRAADVRWLLCDTADAVLPELGPALGERTLRLLRGRGVEVRLGTSVKQIRADAVTLSDGTDVPTRTVVWTAGVTASPLIAATASRHRLPLDKGRLKVDAFLAVAGWQDVWALGDGAAVPDLTRPGQVTPPTAQHAQRQAKTAARNVAASLGVGRPGRYRHHDLGLVVDLAGRDAVARPLRIPLSGLAAKTVTRGYHLMALPSTGNRIRVAVDWLLDAVLARSAAQLGYIPEGAVALPAAEHTKLYQAMAGTAGSMALPHGQHPPSAATSG